MVKSRIPSEAEFKAFLAISDPKPDPELLSLAATVEASETGALVFFKRHFEVSRERERKLGATAVWKWLGPQPDFQRAIQAAFRRYRSKEQPESDEQTAADRARRAARFLQPMTNDELRTVFLRLKRNQSKPIDETQFEDWKRVELAVESRERRFRFELETHVRRSWQVNLMHEIVRALYRYFSNHAEEHLRVWRKFEHAREAAHEVLRLATGDIAAAARELEGHTLTSVQPDRLTYPIKKFLDELDRAERRLMPVRRRDATLRERLYLWDLNQAFGRLHDLNRAAALHHLLGIEGIEHQLELRNVQRILAGWKGS